MTGRSGELRVVVRRAIGAAVLKARKEGVRWKDLELRFERSRVQLWRYAGAVGQDETQFPQDETQFPQDETPSRLHRGADVLEDRDRLPVLSLAEPDRS
jgi:hypothetical protein